MAFFRADGTLVVPYPDVAFNPFHHEAIPRQHPFREKWTGRTDREGILLWARGVPAYHHRKPKASSSNTTRESASRGDSRMPIYPQSSASGHCKPTVQVHSAFVILHGSRFCTRNIEELMRGAHAQVMFHARVQNLACVRIHLSVPYIPLTCFSTDTFM